MHHPVAHDLGICQRGDRLDDFFLIAPFCARLKADHIQQAAFFVLAAQLHHSKRRFAGVRIAQADGLHRAEEQRLIAALGHRLDRHAPLKKDLLFKILRRDPLCAHERVVKHAVFLGGQRAVQIICALALVIARLPECAGHIHALCCHDRRCRVVEIERVRACQRFDRGKQGVRGQRSRGTNDHVVLRQRFYLFADHLDVWMGFDLFCDPGGKRLTIDRLRTTGRHTRVVRRFHDKRAHAAQLLLEQPGTARQLVGAQRIAADQLSKAAGVMGDRLFLRAHFVESDRASPAGDLPGRFRSCQTGADHCDCVCLSHHFHHRSLLYNYNSYWNIPC